jgi:hypothetical protein
LEYKNPVKLNGIFIFFNYKNRSPNSISTNLNN